MIGVSSTSRSFAGLSRYLVVGRDNVQEGRVAWSASRNLPTDDPELAAKIMRATAAQNARVSQPVYHVSLSFDPRDVVDRATMERVADRVLAELKLQEHQAIIVAHADRRHPHVHILVNRIHPETGRAWDRWHDHTAIQRALQEQERALGLRIVEGRSANDQAQTKGLRTIEGEFETQERVSQIVERRYEAERDVAAAEARVCQVDNFLRRESDAQAAFTDCTNRAYKTPTDAREAFFRVAEQAGEREATRRMRETPESFGELKTTVERQSILGRATTTDTPARDLAREAAGYGAEVVAARRELARVTGIDRGTQATWQRGEGDAAVYRAQVGSELERARGQVRAIAEAERSLPTREEIEFRLSQALRRLSPPEYQQLRWTLSPQRLTLAHKLRQAARDTALGRDE